MSTPIDFESLVDKFGLDAVNRAAAVHDTYIVQGGKSREKYMERLALEFKGLSKADLDLLDGYHEHKRHLRAKTKALYRDWERDKKDLKDRTVKLIEEEVAETREKLLKELELFRIESKKERKHTKLEEKRKDYEAKMKIIEEIEAEKRRAEEAYSK